LSRDEKALPDCIWKDCTSVVMMTGQVACHPEFA
jgi:hypothetical protein